MCSAAVRLHGNSVVTKGIKGTAGHGNAVYMASINTLTAVVKCAILHNNVLNLAVVGFAVVTDSRAVGLCSTAGSKATTVEGYTVINCIFVR